MAGGVHQFRVVDADGVNPGQGLEPAVFFDADGGTIDLAQMKSQIADLYDQVQAIGDEVFGGGQG